MFGWGPKDQTTKDERAAWKDNAKSQMDGKSKSDDSDESTDDSTKHRRAYRPK